MGWIRVFLRLIDGCGGITTWVDLGKNCRPCICGFVCCSVLKGINNAWN